MTIVNRLRKMKAIYLCGPIAGCTEEDMRGWRERIKNHVSLQKSETFTWPERNIAEVELTSLFHYLDPTDRVYTEAEESDAIIAKEIVLNDKYYISQSDIVLANLSQLGKYKCVGSIMEIIYSYGLGKYVITIMDPETPVSPWISYHSTRVVHSEQEAVDVLRELV